MPEEINRIVTDQLSDLLFTTSPEAKINLLNEGKSKDQIFFVGNTMIDSLKHFEKNFNPEPILKRVKLKLKEYILLTVHRPSNVDNIKKFSNLVEAIKDLSLNKPII